MKVDLIVSTYMELGGEFEGDSIAECIAMAQLEARVHSEIVSQYVQVLGRIPKAPESE